MDRLPSRSWVKFKVKGGGERKLGYFRGQQTCIIFFGPGKVLAFLRRKIKHKKATYHFDFTMAPKDEERAD